MIGHTVAVYEHLYSMVRRGEVGRGELGDDLGVILLLWIGSDTLATSVSLIRRGSPANSEWFPWS